MHRIFGIIGTIAAVIGFLLMAQMFWASANSGGMAVLGLQVLGLMGSVAAIILGGIGLLLARGKPAASGFSNFAFGLGLGTILALAIAYLLF